MDYTKIKINVSTTPASVKYKPFLKMEDLGANIQKEEMTKNSKEMPKNMLRKYNGSADFA